MYNMVLNKIKLDKNKEKDIEIWITNLYKTTNSTWIRRKNNKSIQKCRNVLMIFKILRKISTMYGEIER